MKMFGVGEFLTEVISRIEPGAHGSCVPGRRFPKHELAVTGRLQPVVGNRENGVNNLALIAIEDLYNMAIGTGIEEPKDVLTGR
jgi:hypothetical protein